MLEISNTMSVKNKTHTQSPNNTIQNKLVPQYTFRKYTDLNKLSQ